MLITPSLPAHGMCLRHISRLLPVMPAGTTCSFLFRKWRTSPKIQCRFSGSMYDCQANVHVQQANTISDKSVSGVRFWNEPNSTKLINAY
uniref:Uncharacterized protein n=1 Tax=Anguilla anguilla TaxID=7936 RepID=A0A0E9XHG1_ANGAN